MGTGDGDGTTAPPVKSYPPPFAPVPIPPPAAAPRILNLVTAAAAATAGFLGYCEVAGILALLSLIFGFWDFFQHREPRRDHHRHDPGGPPADLGNSVPVPTEPNNPARPPGRPSSAA